MKLLIKIILVLTLLVSLPFTALAQNTAFPVSRCNHRAVLNQLKQNVQDKKQEILQKQEEKRASISAKLASKKKQNITKYFNQMMQKLQTATDKLNNLHLRIETRLEQIKQEDPNLDTQTIEEWLYEAKDRISASQDALLTAQNSLDTILENDDPKQAFFAVKNLVLEIKKQLVETHRILVHVIGDIKGLKVGQNTQTQEGE